jgi:hypothetical protein
MALAMAGYFSVQSLPRRVKICTLPASSRACIRYPSSFNSCSQSGRSGASLTNLASCGLIQVGGRASSILRRVRTDPKGVARDDLAIGTMYRIFAVSSVY